MIRDIQLLIVSPVADHAQARKLIDLVLPRNPAGAVRLVDLAREVLPGESLADFARQKLQGADGVLLLLSGNFLNDDVMCMPLVEAARVRWPHPSPPILPLLISPCPWRESSMRQLRPYGVGDKALTQHPRVGLARAELAEYVQDWIAARFPAAPPLVGAAFEIEDGYRRRVAEDLARKSYFVEPLMQIVLPELSQPFSSLRPQTICRTAENMVQFSSVAVFLGGSSSGKTTLLHALGHRAAACGILSSSVPMSSASWRDCAAPVLPVFARVGELFALHTRHRGDAWDLLALLADYLPGSGSASKQELTRLLRQASLAGRLLILLDDLQDAGNDEFQRMLENSIIDLVAQSPSGNRIVVTGPLDLRLLSGLAQTAPRTQIQGLARSQVEKYLMHAARTGRLWGGGPPNRVGPKGRQLLVELDGDPNLRTLVENPQMLEMWVFLRSSYPASAAKGSDRVTLLSQYVDRRLRHCGKESRGTLVGPARAKQRAESILHQLALGFLESEARLSMSRQQVKLELAIESHDNDTLSDIARLTGLLTEDREGRIAFVSTTFLAYFAATALARMTPDERWQKIRFRLRDPRWREPIIFCLCLLNLNQKNQSASDQLLQQILDLASDSKEAAPPELFLVLAGALATQRVTGPAFPILVTQLQKCTLLQLPVVCMQAMDGIARLAQHGVACARTAITEGLAVPNPGADFIRSMKPLVDADPSGSVAQRLREVLHHPSPAVQAAAIRALDFAAQTYPELRQELVPFLDSVDNEVLKAAFNVLMPLFARDDELQRQLRSRIVTANPRAVTAALTAVHDEQLAEPSLRELFDWQLREQSPAVRAILLLQLLTRAVSEPAELALLLAALDDPHLVVRNAMLDCLCYLSRWDPGIRDAVLARIDADWPTPQPELTAQLVNLNIVYIRFLNLCDSVVWERLRPKLRHPDQIVREAVVNALTPWVEQLTELQDDLWAMVADNLEAPEVRELAIAALLPVVALYPEKRPLIERRMRTETCYEEHPNFSMLYALQQLARIDVPTQRLLHSLLTKSANPYERCALLCILRYSRPRDQEVFNELMALLPNPNPGLALPAFQALAPRLTNKSLARAEVQQLLGHGDIWVRRAAVQWLIRLPMAKPGVRQAVVNQLSDSDPHNFLFVLLDLMFSECRDAELFATCASALTRFNTAQSDPMCRISVDILAIFLYKHKKSETALARIRSQNATLGSYLSEMLIQLRALLANSEHLATRLGAALQSAPDLDPLLQFLGSFGLGKIVQGRGIDPMAILGHYLDSPNPRLQLTGLGALSAASPPHADATLEAKALDSSADLNTRVASLAMLTARGQSSARVGQLRMLLEDPIEAIRFVALLSIIPLAATDRDLASLLIPWLGLITEGAQDLRASLPAQQSLPWKGATLRMQVAIVLARHLRADDVMYQQVVDKLTSTSWQERQGAAWALSLMPAGPSANIRQRIRQLTQDRRTDENLPERLQAARALLSMTAESQPLLSDILPLTSAGLRYGLEPRQLIPLQGQSVRQLALRLSAALPHDQQPRLLIEQRARQDPSADVREQAYQLLVATAQKP